jgi:hypothetical protein
MNRGFEASSRSSKPFSRSREEKLRESEPRYREHEALNRDHEISNASRKSREPLHHDHHAPTHLPKPTTCIAEIISVS